MLMSTQKQLTDNQCLRLKEMGLPQELTIGDCYYNTIVGGMQTWRHETSPKFGYYKLPSNDDLEEFAKIKAIEKYGKTYDPERLLLMTFETFGLGWGAKVTTVPMQVPMQDDNVLEWVPVATSKSLALFALIEKLYKMIGEKDE